MNDVKPMSDEELDSLKDSLDWQDSDEPTWDKVEKLITRLNQAEAEREDLRKRYHEMLDLSASVDRAQKAKIAELQSVVDKLPKTADGVVVCCRQSDSVKLWCIVAGEIEQAQEDNGYYYYRPYTDEARCLNVSRCYSTREAAESALKEKTDED